MTTEAQAIAKSDEQAEVGFLALIEKVVSNPEVSVEKVKALLDMEIQLKDRHAESEFDAALIEAQNEIEALQWDKVNLTNKSRHVSYPKIEAMIKPIRKKYGFVQSYDTEPSDKPNTMVFCCDVAHKGGHRRRYRLPMPIDGAGPKGGGVMTGPQAVGNGSSYAMRYLDKMIWNIPMLVDSDDNDGNAPFKTVSKEQEANLKAMIDEIGGGCERAFLAYYKIEKISDLGEIHYQNALKALQKKRRGGK